MNLRRNGVKPPLGSSKVYAKTRSLCIEEERRRQHSIGGNSNRYKTELCRPYQEYGYCKYGEKCQFAHGEHDLRVLPRHPKYKTELCRTYHAKGFCPYGTRCHFIHNLDEGRKPDNGAPKSPKKPLSFSLPISPSLDSGISSPDDIANYVGGRAFEFPGSESSGSDEGDPELDQQMLYCPGGVRDQTYYPMGDDLNSGIDLTAQREQIASPDLFELDALSTGSGSPTKPVSDGFTSISDPTLELSDLFMGMVVEDSPSVHTPSGRRLPVFDDMLNSKSDTALTMDTGGGRPFALFP